MNRLALALLSMMAISCAPRHEALTSQAPPPNPAPKPVKEGTVTEESLTREQEILKQERITFADVQEVVLSKCTGCHRAGGKHDDLSSLEAIRAGKGLIRPGDPDNSNIYFQISIGLMPPGKSPQVTSDGLSVLKRWIEEGAVAE